MKWCCYIFEDLAACAGEADLSVVVVTIGGQDSFVLQGRAVDANTDVRNWNVPFKVTTLTQQAIFHCPGCGVRLHQYYKNSIEPLSREDLNGR